MTTRRKAIDLARYNSAELHPHGERVHLELPLEPVMNNVRGRPLKAQQLLQLPRSCYARGFYSSGLHH